jgi:flagellar hook-associated protein 1 FlgK
MLIRDGGFGGPGYLRNANGLAGYQVRISELADAMDRVLNFGTLGGIGGSASLKDFSANSASWIEARRQEEKVTLDATNAIKSRASISLSQVTGVNIDQEMATLLDLEKSYQASSKVLSVVNAMLATLLEVVS